MSARDDYPIASHWAGGGSTRTASEFAAALDEIDLLREALRRHVMDFGDCDHPETCACSHASALKVLAAQAPEGAAGGTEASVTQCATCPNPEGQPNPPGERCPCPCHYPSAAGGTEAADPPEAQT